MRIRAVSLDLDDTLWPITPVMLRAEQRLQDWLHTHCPEVADSLPSSLMRELRDRAFTENPHLAHDFTALRKISLRTAFNPLGLDEHFVERAFTEFYAARNEVECYADVLPSLKRLAALVPLVSISNGNADLGCIGIKHFFHFSVSARDCGVAKPHPAIFHAACKQLGFPPASVLHVGDDAALDVEGARAAGLKTVWLSRDNQKWQGPMPPTLIAENLCALADWLEIQLKSPSP